MILLEVVLTELLRAIVTPSTTLKVNLDHWILGAVSGKLGDILGKAGSSQVPCGRAYLSH